MCSIVDIASSLFPSATLSQPVNGDIPYKQVVRNVNMSADCIG